jgi:hypothetical protein
VCGARLVIVECGGGLREGISDGLSANVYCTSCVWFRVISIITKPVFSLLDSVGPRENPYSRPGSWAITQKVKWLYPKAGQSNGGEPTWSKLTLRGLYLLVFPVPSIPFHHPPIRYDTTPSTADDQPHSQQPT